MSVLRWLLRQGDEWMSFHRPASANNAARVAQGYFTPLTMGDLESHLLHRGRRGQFCDNEAIYIRPPAKEDSTVAAIWCRWNFEAETPKCGFYFGTWRHDGPNGGHIAFVGFRYETPEEGDNHNYYHAQPCRSMGVDDMPAIPALPISDRNPTWPLAAESALELLLCLVVSVYGMRGLAAFEGTLEEDVGLRAQVSLGRAVKRIRARQKASVGASDASS